MYWTKYIIHISILTLWLFACIGQPVITIIDDGKPLVTNNINEEEQKEQQSKKNNEEEKIISKSLTDFLFASNFKEQSNIDTYRLGHSDCVKQIVLPPPEQFI